MAFVRNSPPSSSNGMPTSESLTPGTNVVSGSFSADGNSLTFTPNESRFTFSMWVAEAGTFAATVVIQRSHDSGTTWMNVTAGGSTLYSFTAACDEDMNATVTGDIYRAVCSDFAGTEISYRFGQ